jgi:hypothetical protein
MIIIIFAGMSYNGIAISEKHSDVPFSSESRSGIPFNFLMRDILQFDNTIYDAMKYDCTLPFIILLSLVHTTLSLPFSPSPLLSYASLSPLLII